VYSSEVAGITTLCSMTLGCGEAKSRSVRASPAGRPMAYLGITDDWLLRTVGIRLLSGRDFTNADAADSVIWQLASATSGERPYSPRMLRCNVLPSG
jgi:hypothetical protein